MTDTETMLWTFSVAQRKIKPIKSITALGAVMLLIGYFIYFIHTSDYLSYLRRKQTITVVLQYVYLLLFMCFLLSVQPYSIAYFLSLRSIIFTATNANPQPALFRVTNIWRNTTLPAVRCKSFTYYKVVWWHFSGAVGKG